MKKIIFFYSLLCFTISMNAQQRDRNAAIGVAQQFLSTSNARQLTGTNNNQLRLFKTGKDNAYYMFTPEDGSGFVVVSGDERMTPVLGYSYSSEVVTKDMPDNLKYWLSLYEGLYQSLQSGETNNVHRSSTFTNLQTDIEPIVTAKWGQSSPYYDRCPVYRGSHCVVGCVATAMTQVMAHYKYPACGKDSVSYKTSQHNIAIAEDLSMHPFDWDNILDSYSASTTAMQDTAVANLCYMAGVAVRMDYSPDGSGSTEKKQIEALYKNFGYDEDMGLYYADNMTAEEWHELLQYELSQGRPLLYCGQDSYWGGHAFILDGYKAPTDSTNTPYYHFNWGWNGSSDDYFVISDLNPSGYHFTHDHDVIAEMKPDDGIKTRNSLIAGSCSLSTHKMSTDAMQEISADVSIHNYALRNFTGKVTFRLLKPDGSTTDLQSYDFVNFFSNKGFRNRTFTFTPDASAGTYTLQAVSQAEGSTTEEKAYFGSDLSIVVTGQVSDIKVPQFNKTETPVEVYSIDGKRQEVNSRGINIVRMKDGTTKKVAQ